MAVRQLPLILLLAWFAFDFFVAPCMGMEQVSVLVWRLGLAAQLVAVGCLLLLCSHLLFKWPVGPAE